MIWLVIGFVFLLSLSMSEGNVTINCYPVFPTKGEPVSVTVTLHNPSSEPHNYMLSVYSNGVKTADYTTEIKAGSQDEFRIMTVASGDLIGKSQNTYVEVVNTETGAKQEASAMIPPYPPEIFSSFVSFASFSSTIMTYMQSLSYFTTVMTPLSSESSVSAGLNAGLVVALSLIGLLVFVELSDPAYGKVGRRLLDLRNRYAKQAIILFIIFSSMVLTRVIMLLYGI